MKIGYKISLLINQNICKNLNINNIFIIPLSVFFSICLLVYRWWQNIAFLFISAVFRGGMLIRGEALIKEWGLFSVNTNIAVLIRGRYLLEEIWYLYTYLHVFFYCYECIYLFYCLFNNLCIFLIIYSSIQFFIYAHHSSIH